MFQVLVRPWIGGWPLTYVDGNGRIAGHEIALALLFETDFPREQVFPRFVEAERSAWERGADAQTVKILGIIKNRLVPWA